MVAVMDGCEARSFVRASGVFFGRAASQVHRSTSEKNSRPFACHPLLDNDDLVAVLSQPAVPMFLESQATV